MSQKYVHHFWWGQKGQSIIERKIWLLVISFGRSCGNRQSLINPGQAWCIALQGGCIRVCLWALVSSDWEEVSYGQGRSLWKWREERKGGEVSREFCLWIVHDRGSPPMKESMGALDTHGHTPCRLLLVRCSRYRPLSGGWGWGLSLHGCHKCCGGMLQGFLSSLGLGISSQDTKSAHTGRFIRDRKGCT
jgi:hypothetical protein